MVAISLYKGNLHKVATDVPRRWLIPTPKISLKDFRVLLRRRAKALSRLQSIPEAATAAPAAVTTTSNPNPTAADNPFSKVEPQIVPLQVEPPKDEKKEKEEEQHEEAEVEGDKETVAKAADGVEFPEKLVEGSDVVLETKVDALKVEKSETPANPSGEV